jgi:hypothetical protein
MRRRGAGPGAGPKLDRTLVEGSVVGLELFSRRLVADYLAADPSGPRWLEAGWRHAAALHAAEGRPMPTLAYCRVATDAIDLHVVGPGSLEPLGAWYGFSSEPGWWVLERSVLVAEDLSSGTAEAAMPLVAPVGVDETGVPMWVNLEATGGLALGGPAAASRAFELVATSALCGFLSEVAYVVVGLGAGWPADLVVPSAAALERATRYGAPLPATARRTVVVCGVALSDELLGRLALGGRQPLVVSVGELVPGLATLGEDGVVRGEGIRWPLGVV